MAKRRYVVPLPHSRGKIRSADVVAAVEAPVIDASLTDINDMFLHVLFARIATSSGVNHEFGSSYSPEQNTLEIDVPDDILEFIENVEIRPKFQRYIAWLTQSSQFWHKYKDSRDQTSITTEFPNVEVQAITFRGIYDNGSSSAIDWKLGNKQTVTIANSTALTFQHPAGPTALQLIIKQDNIGHPVAFPSYLLWPGGTPTTVTQTPEAIDVLSLIYDGNQYLATMIRNFS